MNKDEIKKALQCCSAVGFDDGCSVCPYDCRCNELDRDALNIITEQEKEIDRLRAKIKRIDELLKEYEE